MTWLFSSRKKEQNPNRPEIVASQVVSSSTWTQLWTVARLAGNSSRVGCLQCLGSVQHTTASSVLVNGDSLQLAWSVSGWSWWTVYLVLVLKVVAMVHGRLYLVLVKRGLKGSVLNSFPATLSAFSNVVSDCHMFTTRCVGQSAEQQSSQLVSFSKNDQYPQTMSFLGIVFPPAPKSYAVQPIR